MFASSGGIMEQHIFKSFIYQIVQFEALVENIYIIECTNQAKDESEVTKTLAYCTMVLTIDIKNYPVLAL